MRAELVGASDLRKALRNFSPDLDKEVRDEMISFLQPVVKKARGYMPSNDAMPSGFVGISEPDRFPKYEAKIARRGIGYKLTSTKPNNRGWSSTVSIHNKTRAGAIYETAGSKSGIVGKFTPNLRGTLTKGENKYHGRAMFRALVEDEGKAKAGVIQALEKAAAKFNARGV
jgi:hypothetical protein